MESLIPALGVANIVLVLLIFVPQIIKFVTWIIKLVRKHNENQREAYEEGYEAALEDDETEERFQAGEKYMKELGQREDKLETILLNQQQQIQHLTDSDNLNIKRTIKRTWDKVVKQHRAIDAYELSLLEDQYAIYTARGGNSWAKKMMEDIRRSATTTEPIEVHTQDQK